MAWAKRIRNLFRRDEVSQRIDEEFAFHLAEKVDELIDQGMSEAEARDKARQQFGNATARKEQTREADLTAWLETFAQDTKYAFRSLRAQPGYTATAVLSLVLGIGANTAIFSIINSLMLRSLPVEDPHSLVQLTLSENDDELNTPIWQNIRDRQTSFSGVLAYSPERFELSDGGESRTAPGLWVSGDFFKVLGVRPLLGRTFDAADERWGGGRDGKVAVISHRFWKSQFQADSNVVGKTLRLNRQTFTIVGVTPQWFTGLDVGTPFDVATPLGAQPILHPDHPKESDEVYHWWLRILGRLRPGESMKQADDRLRAITADIFRGALPPEMSAEDKARTLNSQFRMQRVGWGFSKIRNQYRTSLLALMATTALVLLIACANLANLLLARSAARRREISVRMAIGASRWRVIRQLMTESLLLAIVGASGGLLFAQWGSRILVRLISTSSQPVQLDLSPDLRILAFAAGVCILTTVLFGLGPAVRASGFGGKWLAPGDGNALAGPSRLRAGKALAVAQVALSLVLLTGAALFLGTLRNLLRIDPGFDRQNLLVVTIDAEPMALPAERRTELYRELQAKAQSIPGVLSVSASVLAPIGPEGWAQPVSPEGVTLKSPRDGMVFFNRVSPGYFGTVKTRIVLGRDFSERDRLNSPRVMIINESVAKRFFGSANPIGKTIAMDGGIGRASKEVFQVIGVVGDARYNRIDEKQRSVAYLSTTQTSDPPPTMRLEVRTERPPEYLIPSLRSTLMSVNRGVSLQFQTVESQVSESLLRPRLVALLSAAFGALALFLAMVGLYGVTSYRVTQRRKELGVRMALGAHQRVVAWLIVRELLTVLICGVVVGVAAALAAGRLVAALLYGLQPHDPAQLSLAALILIAGSVIAAYLPVRRATRLDPMSTLRSE